jgi:hypothetical protein
MRTSESIIAVLPEEDRADAVLERGMAVARERKLPLILFDAGAPPSPLESPLPTDWSGDGEEQLYGNRLGPRELEMAGRQSLARVVIRARGEGVDTFAWLPEKVDAPTLAEYARDQHAALVILPAGESPLASELDVPTEVVGDEPDSTG